MGDIFHLLLHWTVSKPALSAEGRQTEVERKWALGLSSWSLPRGVIGALFSLDTLRTKVLAGAELYWSKEIRWPHLLLLKSGKPP